MSMPRAPLAERSALSQSVLTGVGARAAPPRRPKQARADALQTRHGRQKHLPAAVASCPPARSEREAAKQGDPLASLRHAAQDGYTCGGKRAALCRPAGRLALQKAPPARGKRVGDEEDTPFARACLPSPAAKLTNVRSCSGCRSRRSSCRNRRRQDGAAGFRNPPQNPWWQNRWTGCPPWLQAPCSGRR